MANSFVRYTGDGNTSTYSIPFSYRVAGDLTVTLNAVATTAFSFNAAGTTITFNSPPANSTAIEIRRTTSQTSRLTDYASGSVLTESDLDTDSTQSFFMSQEAIDDAGDKIKIDSADFQWDATNKRIKNVAAPTADTDAVNKAFISTNLPNITTVSGISSDVTTVAGISANVTTVAGNNANVTTVANNTSNINTVATNIADVVTVANDLNEAISEIETAANDLNEATSEIDTVATNITDVDTVGTNIANVNTVAGISANVTTVAGISANVTSVAGNETNINSAVSNASNINSAVSNASNINTVAGISSDVTAVAGNNTNVTAVAGNSTNINAVAADAADIGTVAGISANVTAVAGNSTNINAVNANSTNINTVAGAAANINTVANNNTNVNTVAGIDGNISTVAGISSDVTAVAGDATDIGTVAGQSTQIGLLGTADAVSDMNTLATAQNVTNMNTLAGISANITTTATNNANITTVAGGIANVNSVAGNAANINSVANIIGGTQTFVVTEAGGVFVIDGANNPALTLIKGFTYTFDVSDNSVSGHPLAFKDSGGSAFTTGVTVNGTAGTAGATVVIAVPASGTQPARYYCTTHGNGMGNTITTANNEVAIVAANITDVSTTAGAITNVNNVGGSIANVNTVAGNLSGVNSFGERYKVAASDPSSSLDAGDLVFNTSAAALKYYDGANWQQIVAGSLTDIVQDGSPQLGGDIDVNGNSIVSVSNGNISITPNGAGKVILDGLSHPTADGNANEVLKTDGAGNLSFGVADIVADTTPQLGGNLDLNGNNITGTGDINITGGVTMSGNLTVNGTTTTINSTTLTVDDINMVLASGAADSAAADGAGITVDGASAELKYVHSGTKWTVNKDFDVTGNIIVSGTVDGIDVATRDGILTSTTTTANAALPKAGGTMSGAITFDAAQATGNSALVPAAGTSGHFLKHDGTFGQIAYADLSGAPSGVGGATGVDFNDDVKARFGTGNDLEIYHNASHSFIKNGTGDFNIINDSSGSSIYIQPKLNENAIKCDYDGAVTLYHDNTAKLATSSNGATITGDLANTSGNFVLNIAGNINLDADGGDIAFMDAGTEFGRIYNNSSSLAMYSPIQDADIRIQGNDGGTVINCVTFDVSNAGAATFNNDVTAFSDERLKTNIKTIDNALDKVSQMRGVTFDREGRASSGLIAQEFEKIAPELVKTADDEMGTKSVAYANTVGYLIEAIKELKVDLDKHKKHCTCGAN